MLQGSRQTLIVVAAISRATACRPPLNGALIRRGRDGNVDHAVRRHCQRVPHAVRGLDLDGATRRLIRRRAGQRHARSNGRSPRIRADRSVLIPVCREPGTKADADSGRRDTLNQRLHPHRPPLIVACHPFRHDRPFFGLFFGFRSGGDSCRSASSFCSFATPAVSAVV